MSTSNSERTQSTEILTREEKILKVHSVLMRAYKYCTEGKTMYGNLLFARSNRSFTISTLYQNIICFNMNPIHIKMDESPSTYKNFVIGVSEPKITYICTDTRLDEYQNVDISTNDFKFNAGILYDESVLFNLEVLHKLMKTINHSSFSYISIIEPNLYNKIIRLDPILPGRGY